MPPPFSVPIYPSSPSFPPFFLPSPTHPYDVIRISNLTDIVLVYVTRV